MLCGLCPVCSGTRSATLMPMPVSALTLRGLLVIKRRDLTPRCSSIGRHMA
ncbi:hypothetical protein D9M73_269830 [compost metagenome]